MIQKCFFYWQPNTQWFFVQKVYWYKFYWYKLYCYKLYLISCTKRSLKVVGKRLGKVGANLKNKRNACMWLTFSFSTNLNKFIVLDLVLWFYLVNPKSFACCLLCCLEFINLNTTLFINMPIKHFSSDVYYLYLFFSFMP